MLETESFSIHDNDNELVELIQFHNVNMLIGAMASLICLATLAVFFSSKHFFRHNKLLTLLGFADLCSSFGILMLGMMRKALYDRLMETSQVPVETSWTCASKPYVYLRLVGVLIPPWVLAIVSIERLLAVFAPNFYRRHISPYPNIAPLVIILYCGIAMVVAYSIAWHYRTRLVDSYCGRKKTIAPGFTKFVFLTNIIGFCMAFLINVVTTCRLARVSLFCWQNGPNSENRKHMRRMHYLLVISLLAVLLVAVPNALFLSSPWLGPKGNALSKALSEPSNWMIAARSSANLGVYLLLKEEFRRRVYEMLGCLSSNPNREREYEVSALGGISQNRVAIVGQWNQQAKNSILLLSELAERQIRSINPTERENK
uniref:G_PROTEIN_RECEP_F1_2 domain-containing protein n=1 Tax=Globodera pallida TaxID=36090 RepID=A0A183BUN6_GLOPA